MRIGSSLLGFVALASVSAHGANLAEIPEPDAAVLCAALSDLASRVPEWNPEITLVFADRPALPQFPWSTCQAALAAAVDERFNPFEQPDQGQALVLAEGPIIPFALVSSAITRSRTLCMLPTPACGRFLVADGHWLDELFRDDIPEGWRRFRGAFPQAADLLECSAPGYDAARTEAIVSCSVTGGALNGIGVFLLLTKEKSGWQVAWSKSLWVS